MRIQTMSVVSHLAHRTKACYLHKHNVCLVAGTYGPVAGGQLCQMCPTNFTNGADGSSSCPLVIPPGTNLAERYAVIVSFGVFFNGTALRDIAARVGVQGSPYEVLSNLVRCGFGVVLGLPATAAGWCSQPPGALSLPNHALRRSMLLSRVLLRTRW